MLTTDIDDAKKIITEHFTKTPRFANGDVQCMYLMEDGRKCAVGALLDESDYEYLEECKEHAVAELFMDSDELFEELQGHVSPSEAFRTFCRQAQNFHDHWVTATRGGERSHVAASILSRYGVGSDDVIDEATAIKYMLEDINNI
jgi:hypothetical protein